MNHKSTKTQDWEQEFDRLFHRFTVPSVIKEWVREKKIEWEKISKKSSKTK